MGPPSPLLGDRNDSLPDRGRNSGPDISVADRSQKTKTAGSKRRKTFTGCWTCRERHVKCDEQRPTCKRCLAGNFTCQGYSTRLTWLTPMSQKVAKSSGRSRPMVAAGPSVGIDFPTGTSFSATQASEQRPMAKRMRHADQRSRAATTTDPAIREVRQAQGPGLDAIQTNQAIVNISEPALLGGYVDGKSISMSRKDTVNSEREDHDSWLWPTVGNSYLLQGMEHILLYWKTNSQQLPMTGMAISHPFDEIYIPRIGSPMKPFEIPTAAARERQLISHWSTNLADKLVPFRSPVNPFLTVVCPMALEGSRMARTKSSCTVALFHAVCAISAAHQANLGACPSDDGLVEHHKQLSFQHLMRNIDRTDPDERMACLATLCLWILIHFVTGTPGAWRDVIKITRDLLARVSAMDWGQSTTAALTYHSFSTSFALIQAQYVGRQESLAPLPISLPGLDMVKSQTIPTRSLELLSSFNARLTLGTVLAPEEIDQLEIEFALSTPEPSTGFDAGNTASALLHHHRSLFYYTSMLYFRGNSGRRGPEDDVQNLVSRCLEHMEQIDLLQKDASPKTWIYAAVASEAANPELRHRARCLFSKRMSLGIATWHTLLHAVEEIWKRRDTSTLGLIPESWTRVLASMPELDVVLY